MSKRVRILILFTTLLLGILIILYMSSYIIITTSGELKKDGNWLISNDTRFRAHIVILSPIKDINIKFKTINDTDIIQEDLGGAIRRGIYIWMGYKDICDHYQTYWRNDTNYPGKYIIGAQIKENPGETDKNKCAGTGYAPLKGGSNVKTDFNFDDGKEHDFRLEFINQTDFKIYVDGNFIFETEDINRTFPIWTPGIRIDNKKVKFMYIIDNSSDKVPIIVSDTG